MMAMPCGNTAALREYERQVEVQERLAERAEQIGAEEAMAMMRDPAQLHELVTDYDAAIWTDLSGLLDPDTCGERIEHYRSQIRDLLIEVYIRANEDRILEAAEEEGRV